MGAKRVGTVIAIDVARLFRDYTDKEPATFASRMDVQDVNVITQVDNHWILLTMTDTSDNQRFRELARSAAAERKVIRARTMAARERCVLDGGYSGAPAPFGWAVQPKQNRHESIDGKEHSGRLYVYPPHATIKKEIMQLSLRPEIRSLRQLRDLLVVTGIKIPPFELDIAAQSFSRSVLCRAYMSENGVRRQVNKVDSFTPSTRTIEGILLEPLAVGDRLYGSGKHGAWKAKRLEKQMQLHQDQRSDHMLRTYREFIDTRPDLAVCTTDEEIEMYFRVCEKWSKFDAKVARESSYRVEEKNPSCIRKIGRGTGSGHRHFNEWADHVFCIKHGSDEQYKFLHTHHLRRDVGRGDWMCTKQYVAGDAAACCVLG